MKRDRGRPPTPRGAKIVEDRLHPGIAGLQNDVARRPAGVAPQIEKIGGCQGVMEQQRRADADAGEFQRRRGTILKPGLRPGPAEGCKPVAGEAGERHEAGHSTVFTVFTVMNSGSIGCFPLNWSAAVKLPCS